MLNKDIEQAREFGRLSTTVASLVTTVAAHAGGQVGGMTGGAAGTDSARVENASHTARSAVITALISGFTTVVVALIYLAAQPVKPTAPAATTDHEARDRLERVEMEMKRAKKKDGGAP